MNKPKVLIAGVLLLALTACETPRASPQTETPPTETPSIEISTPERAEENMTTHQVAPEEPVTAIAASPPSPVVAPSPTPTPTPTPTPETTPEAPAEIDIATIAPAEAVAPPPSVVEILPPPPVVELEPETVIDDDPQQLMGLAGGALTGLLGAPALLRSDADAQVRLYRGRDCMLDVYLYKDGQSLPHYVTYYEFRGDNDARDCLRDLLLAQTE